VLESARTTLGPLVAESLIHNISGFASRSELDTLANPLKKMVNHVQARRWLEAALSKEGVVVNSHVGETERKAFLSKVLLARGGKVTNTAVKDFWLVGRGAKFAYTS
jgi:hypothetical protein